MSHSVPKWSILHPVVTPDQIWPLRMGFICSNLLRFIHRSRRKVPQTSSAKCSEPERLSKHTRSYFSEKAASITEVACYFLQIAVVGTHLWEPGMWVCEGLLFPGLPQPQKTGTNWKQKFPVKFVFWRHEHTPGWGCVSRVWHAKLVFGVTVEWPVW